MKSLNGFAWLAAAFVLACMLLNSNPPIGPGIALAQSDLTAFSQDWEVLFDSALGDDVELARQPRALFICDADGGTIDMAPWRTPAATPASFPVSGGVIYPLSPSVIADTSTAECVIALY